ncbi:MULTISPECIES: hypothetical protein [unclassified Bradyrhizobium]|uniref:hypothetical protein n=1 Tax=unclassified Bradyrhizobium TaxID=2631580 RepID=UPI001FFAA5B5|nr:MULTISPECIES: hypothetical protein [unclassified Bradyrhizobium]MCK1267240.1 hypothetical protein [Bradyrhizobium sp. 84]MCK1374369.1 hypothetical protein [Bradyrhizobium sp. 49]MCK1428994.1 hypothetical protein [Bradyrhizobium sp. 87]
MKRSELIYASVVIAAAAWITDASAANAKRASKPERIKQYTQTYLASCKPLLICTAECQDLYDVLQREGTDLGPPCKPNQ